MRRSLPKQKPRTGSGKARSDAPHQGLSLEAEPDWNVLNLFPVSLWVEDFSRAKSRLDQLMTSGIVDLRKHLDKHPQEVIGLASMVRTVWVNDATLKLYDAQDRAMLYGNLNRVFGEESYAVFKEEIISLAQGKTEFIRETLNMTLGGRKKSILLHVKVDPSHTADLSRVCVAITDITLIKQAEECLKQSEATYRKVFESVVTPLIMIEASTGIIIDANASVQQLLGLPAEELIGQHIRQFCPGDQKEQCIETLDNLVRGRQSIIERMHLCHTDGTEFCVTVAARVIRLRELTCVVLALGRAGQAALQWDRRVKMDRRAAAAVQHKLSERERMVLTQIAEGQSNESIAKRFGISRKTVESHRMRIMQKLDVHKATDLVRYALLSGLLD